MKFRYLPCVLFPVLALPLAAQNQSPTSPAATPAPPLSLQENPVPPAASATASPTAPYNPPATSPAATPNPFVPPPDAAKGGEPPAPAPDSGLGSPGQNPPPSDPNSLIPPPMETLPPSPINTAGNSETQRQQQKVRYYSVKVKADKSEDLISLQNQADKAKSDEAKRQALREYYDLLAQRMKKLDPTLSDWIDTMHAAYLRRLDQVRVEPTIPMGLPPVPSVAPLTAGTPTSSDVPKKKKQPGTDVAPQSTPAKSKPVSKASPKPSPTPSPTPEKRHWFFFKEHPKPSPSPSPSGTPVGKKKVATAAD